MNPRFKGNIHMEINFMYVSEYIWMRVCVLNDVIMITVSMPLFYLMFKVSTNKIMSSYL